MAGKTAQGQPVTHSAGKHGGGRREEEKRGNLAKRSEDVRRNGAFMLTSALDVEGFYVPSHAMCDDGASMFCGDRLGI